MYKIGFVGSNSVGKTALAILTAGELKRRGVEVERIEEAATDARKQGLPINEETTLESQLWILHSWCANRILYSVSRLGIPSPDVLIEDRGPENYCYLENKLGENKPALAMVLEHLNLFPYNKLYRLPIVEKATIDNGVRSGSQTFRNIMDEKIIQFLDKHHIPYTNLPLPEDHDPLRDIWPRIVVNETLQALGRSEKYHRRG